MEELLMVPSGTHSTQFNIIYRKEDDDDFDIDFSDCWGGGR